MHRDLRAILTSSAMDLLRDHGLSPEGSAASKGLAGDWGRGPIGGVKSTSSGQTDPMSRPGVG